MKIVVNDGNGQASRWVRSGHGDRADLVRGLARRIRLIRIGLWLLFAALVAPGASAAAVKVVLRYDDYSSFDKDPRIIDFEQALFEGVRSIGGHLIVGVIPFPGVPHPQAYPPPQSMPVLLGEDKARLLERYVAAGVITPAVHGFNHGNSHRSGSVRSEFAGLTEDQQALLLKTARQALRDELGVDARVFVPPFNTYDESTLRALASTGFEVLSAGRRGVVDETVPLAYLPSTVHPQGLRRAVAVALNEGKEDTLVVATLHPYDFIDTGQSLPEFHGREPQISLDQWLADLREIAAQKGVELVSVQQLLDEHEDLTAARFRANEQDRFGLVSRAPLLDSMHLVASDGTYYARSEAERLHFRQQAVVGLAIVGSALVLLFLLRWALVVFGRHGDNRGA